MLILRIDKRSSVPAYRQICERVVALVESGDLADGDRLPPTRHLARSAGVHRSTVLRAYGELWALGYLSSRPGSYSTIRRPVRTAAVEHEEEPSIIDWQAATRANTETEPAWSPPRSSAGAEVVDFATLSADPHLAPVDELRRCLKSVMLESGRELLGYGEASGHPALKEVITRRMRIHGIEITRDELMITNGAQQALDLVLRLLTSPGERVIVESPTYAAALNLFRLQGTDIACVPMLPDGVDLDALERSMNGRRPALVYTMPTFHNPTGISTSQQHRERLLSICEERGVPLVEDGFEEDLKYSGKTALPIKSMDRRGSVIYLGTFSKVMFSGLRIGWIAAPRECIRRLVMIERASSLSGVALVQAAAARFCQLGLYESYLQRVHKSYRRRMNALLQSLSQHMPSGVEWTRPSGGSVLWLTVRGAGRHEREIAEHLLRDGETVAPGAPFFTIPTADAHFRLSISCVAENRIDAGCRRLAATLARFQSRPDHEPAIP